MVLAKASRPAPPLDAVLCGSRALGCSGSQQQQRLTWDLPQPWPALRLIAGLGVRKPAAPNEGGQGAHLGDEVDAGHSKCSGRVDAQVMGVLLRPTHTSVPTTGPTTQGTRLPGPKAHATPAAPYTATSQHAMCQQAASQPGALTRRSSGRCHSPLCLQGRGTGGSEAGGPQARGKGRGSASSLWAAHTQTPRCQRAAAPPPCWIDASVYEREDAAGATSLQGKQAELGGAPQRLTGPGPVLHRGGKRLAVGGLKQRAAGAAASAGCRPGSAEAAGLVRRRRAAWRHRLPRRHGGPQLAC